MAAILRCPHCLDLLTADVRVLVTVGLSTQPLLRCARCGREYYALDNDGTLIENERHEFARVEIADLLPPKEDE